MSGFVLLLSLALGFDHATHDGKVVASGADAPGCPDCHALERDGRPMRPGHASCFSAPCHSLSSDPAGPSLCLSCHKEPAPRRRARAFFPPYDASPDYGLRFSHERHAIPSQLAGRKGCAMCHRVPETAPPSRDRAAPHARCVPCHGGPAPVAAPMTACASCHPLVAGRVTRPAAERGPYSVGEQFSHATHAPRAPDCRTCHAQVEQAAGDTLPAPTMQSCETCHDGKRAFAALGTTCRRCHTERDGAALPSTRRPEPFGHATHRTRGLALACVSCHSLDAAGAPRPAAATHAPCSDEGCHASDFRAREPRICGACHIGSEPFRPLKADAPRRVRTEFGVDFDHARHAPIVLSALLSGSAPPAAAPPGPAKPAPASPSPAPPGPAKPAPASPSPAPPSPAPPGPDAACRSCHTGIPGGPDRRLGRGHASCAGGSCHAPVPAPGASAPALDDCEACHRLGLLPERDRARAHAPWSVAARFRHRPHDGAQCDQCHEGVAQASRLDELRPPKKPSCAGCHDGRTAFKMTGHGCARCHARQ